jgi:4'-phosphopantetheinyl transferase
MSSSNDLAIVAIAKRPVGIDIEHTAPGRRPESAAAIELTTWVRTEAVLKATGHGLTVDPALVRISPPGDLPRLLGWKGPGRFPVLRMADLKTDPGYLVSLAVIGRGRLRVDLGRMELADRPAVDVKELGVRAVAARQ